MTSGWFGKSTEKRRWKDLSQLANVYFNPYEALFEDLREKAEGDQYMGFMG